nr:MAG TPA: restriction enzyme [Bacteriophage sp.]
MFSSTEQFITSAKEIHGNRYDYSKVKYVDSKTPVTIICPEHGEFEQTPNVHLSNHGCPKCKQSHGEKLIYDILKKYKIPFKY